MQVKYKFLKENPTVIPRDVFISEEEGKLTREEEGLIEERG
jgi:predicted RNA methylase